MTDIAQEEWLPGTSRLIEEEAQNASSHLQRHGNIVLLPQPTPSPNDPLNWSLFRKYWHAFLVCFITALTAATANDAGAAGDSLNIEYGITYDALNTGAGVLFCGIGYFTLLISPAAWLYGRRITYLVCLMLGVVGAIWFARSNSTQDSIWNQLFVGASEACAEANVQLSLSEIFFQHQIGSAVGVYVLATSIGTFLGPLIAGFIADRLDWHWIGWMSVIISMVTVVVTYFTLEETLFDRSAYNGPVIDGVQETTGDHTSETEKKVPGNHLSDPNPESQVEPKKPYWQRVQLITLAPNVKGTGFKQYMARLVHTLRVFSFPAVLFAGLQWGAQDAWLTFYLTLEETNWYEAPWNYSDAGVGLMNIATLIGAVIGCFWGGYLSDRFVYWMAERRNGVREAEDRLWMMLPCGVVSPAGMLLFGIGTAQGWSWPPCYVGLGLIGFGWGCAGDLSISYAMDCYPEMILEGLVGVAVINNSLAMIFTFTVSHWFAASGTQNTMIAVAVLDFFFVCLTIPMVIWGKSCRRWTLAKYKAFVKFRDTL